MSYRHQERKNIFSRIISGFSLQFVLAIFIVLLQVNSQGYGETFSFAIVADPHVYGNVTNRAKFQTAVDWIIDNKDSNDIELVFVLGDIAWGGTRNSRNMAIAKAILDRLNDAGVLYVPVIGDNEIDTGCEKEFNDVFELQYEYLSQRVLSWQKAAVPVGGMYLQNFSFNYKGCHFVCADFNPRKKDYEGGELHDFPGGTWPWFKDTIAKCPKSKKENIVIMSHIGMFRTGVEKADQYLFPQEQMSKIKRFAYNYREYIDTNYVGHIHQNWQIIVWSGLFTPLYNVRVTDETWYDTQWPESDDQELTVRLVQVNNNGPKIIYNQHILNIDVIKIDSAEQK
ncbi:MAG: hypothetical protein A2173_03480 [Planctomycetes bacterium RBG_13_44_8b]|nr:MAG: hypothetical protein A2173_03480 [Planctomycetes bacterium RBG_13_44_8b]